MDVCIWNRVAEHLTALIATSIVTLPQTMKQPGFLQNLQSNDGSVLILLVVIGEESGMGVPVPEVRTPWAGPYHSKPDGILPSIGCTSQGMRMPGRSG
jgi:hypothetical protein